MTALFVVLFAASFGVALFAQERPLPIPASQPSATFLPTNRTPAQPARLNMPKPAPPAEELQRVREGLNGSAAAKPKIAFDDELEQPRRVAPRINTAGTALPLPEPKRVMQTSLEVPEAEEPEAHIADNEPGAMPSENTANGNPDEYDPVLDKPLTKRDPKHDPNNAEDKHGFMGKLPKPSFSGSMAPVISVVGSLLIVLAAFFLVATLLKKVSPKGNRPLPKEAFEDLGRTFLTQKLQLHLLRLGNRLILVSVTPDGVSPITEVTDPDEVVSLLGLCRKLDLNSATEQFHRAVASFSEEELAAPPSKLALTVNRKRSQRSSSLVDLYSEPDESLAEILAKGGRHG
jgi:flagellar biogenesis protein FliO